MRSPRDPAGFAAEAISHLSGAVDSVEGRVSSLLTCDVLAGCLAQFLAGGGFVQQVVSDLKSQTCLLSVFSDRVQFVLARASDDRADANCAADQSAGLGVMNLFELRAGDRFAFGLNVQHLAADQSSGRRGRVSDF